MSPADHYRQAEIILDIIDDHSSITGRAITSDPVRYANQIAQAQVHATLAGTGLPAAQAPTHTVQAVLDRVANLHANLDGGCTECWDPNQDDRVTWPCHTARILGAIR